MPNINIMNNFSAPMANISEYNSAADSNTEHFERGMFDPFQNLLNQKLK
jgi:hypothetical protein